MVYHLIEDSHHEDKTVVRLSYFHDGNLHIWKDILYTDIRPVSYFHDGNLHTWKDSLNIDIRPCVLFSWWESSYFEKQSLYWHKALAPGVIWSSVPYAADHVRLTAMIWNVDTYLFSYFHDENFHTWKDSLCIDIRPWLLVSFDHQYHMLLIM